MMLCLPPRRIAAHGLLLLALALALPQSRAVAQDGSSADYSRAAALPDLTANKVFKTRIDVHWLAGGARFWYRNILTSGTREYVLVDARRGERRPAFDHARLAAALARATGRAADPARLELENLEISNDARALRFRAAGRLWACDLASTLTLREAAPTSATASSPEIKPATAPRRPDRPRRGQRRGSPDGRSPDGRWRAWFQDNNLQVEDLKSHQRFTLSSDGTPADAYSGGLYWSPDSHFLTVLRTRAAQEHKVTLVESSPADQLQPRVKTIDYLKPGDRIAQPRPHLFDMASRKEIPIKNDLFPNPWSIDEVRWEPDSKRFTFLYNQRGHQVLRVVAVDTSGTARAVIDEHVKTFFDYTNKRFTQYLDATREIIWMSERSGWNHLYLYDAATGRVKNPITKGEWVVRRVERVDPEKRQLWFWAGGIRPGQDPYYLHLARVNFDGSGLTILTAGDGTHDVLFSPDGRTIIDRYSRVDLPYIHDLRSAEDGHLICTFEQADASALDATGWKAPERFVAKGRDGQTDIYGVIWRPMHLDPARKYPVIEYIYAGPQGSFVPKDFHPYYRQQSLAELGFIVVQCDGMGTNNRSKAFHDVCWKNLGDSGFPDRIRWIRAAAAKYPYMDPTRVGIYGGSAGGQSALRALLAYGDFYQAAVADSGCHDNRMDKIWWNEQWMGWPLGPEYREQSNVTQAHNLKGKLFLIVGELDTNVDPASTMQVVNALIKANKDFDLLFVPGGGHGIGGAPYGWRRTEDFFVRNLLGATPRH